MRIFANLFLILFLADGGFSLVDELVPLLSPLEPFTALRNILACSVIFMAVPVYLSLGIDRRLPKRLFIPLLLFILWSLISTWLFPALAVMRSYGLILAAAQIVIGMLPLYYFRTGDQRRLTMSSEMFAAPFFSFKNTLSYCAINLFVVPLVLLLLVLATVSTYMAEYTAGFMRLEPGGLRMIERVYRRDSHTIRLAAMIHIGNKAYYDDLTGSVAAGRTIVLAEGVTDDESLLHNSIDYGKMAGFLGLTSQREMRFKGRLIEPEDLDAPLKSFRSGEVAKTTVGADILRADVDVSVFRPPTILLLNAVGKHMQESPSFVKGVLALNAWGEKYITPEMSEIIMDDILRRRNLAVLSYLDKALERYDTIVIPWGALHMKAIEEEVVRRGFKLQDERSRVSIDFRRVLSRSL